MFHQLLNWTTSQFDFDLLSSMLASSLYCN